MSIDAPGIDILFVTGGLDVGGTERHLAMVAQALAARGWKVSLYSLAGDGALRKTIEAAGVEVIRPPFERDKGSRFIVNRCLRIVAVCVHLLSVFTKRRPTVVHFFLPAAYLIGAPLAIMARVPFRLMSRRSLNAYQHGYPGLRHLEKNLHRTMVAIVANSRSVFRELESEEGVPADRLALIYNGIDTSAFFGSTQHPVRGELGISPSAFVMAIVANLIPYKGHDDLLRALALISSELPSGWQLLVAGRDDGVGALLRELASSLGLEKNVRFLGSRRDIPALLAASDVAILCSHEEGFSNSVLEGMAAGLPMVVTNVGGNSEAIVNGESGLVVEPKDPPALAAAILALAKDRELRGRLGNAAQRRVAEHFTLEQCVSRYETMYRKLIGTKAVPR